MPDWGVFNSFFNDKNGCIFSPEEKDFAKTLYPIVERVLKDLKPNGIGADSGNFVDKLIATRKNFRRIVELFRNAKEARKEFEEYFPAWLVWRNKAQGKLKEIACTINKDRWNCNVSNLVGSSAGAIGAIGLIVSVACPLAAPIVMPLAISSAVAGGLGGATVFGTAIVEHVLLKKQVEEAKEVIQKDREAFKVMDRWFIHSNELVEAMEDVLGLNVKLLQSKDFQKIWKRIRHSTFLTYKNIVSNLGTLVKLIKMLVQCPGLIELGLGLSLTSILCTFFFVVVVTHQQNRFLFDCILVTQRLVFGLLSGVDVGIELGRVIATTAMRGTSLAAETLTKTTARIVTHGVFAGIGLALDITNIVLVSIDVHKGSLSEHAKQIKKVARELEKESNFLKDVYLELQYKD